MRKFAVAGSAVEEIVEIVPGRLYALGSAIEVHGDVSWAPADLHGYQRINCYLVLEGNAATLVDTGVTAQQETVVAQLTELLPPGADLSIFLTRSEYECIGGVNAITDAFPVTNIYTGGGLNPFDAFDVVTSLDRPRPGQIGIKRGETAEVGGRVAIISPLLRVLRTYWGFDASTGTLFSSDSFAYTSQPDRAAPTLIDSPQLDQFDDDLLRRHLYAKFGWLRQARTGAIRDELRTILDTHDIRTIAPTHGCILHGAEVVARHQQFLLDELAERDVDRPGEGDG